MRSRVLAVALLALLPRVAGAQGASIQYFGSGPNLSDPTLVTYWDDFIYGNAGYQWTPINCTMQSIVGEDDRPGAIRCVVGASASGQVLQNGGGNTTILGDLDYLRLDTKFDTGANVPKARLGIGNGVTNDPPTAGVYLEHLSADTNWFCVTRTGGAETRTDTGVSFATAYFAAEFTYSASVATCAINGVKVSNAANIPAASTGTTPFLHQITTGTAANVYVDFFKIRFRTTRNPGTGG